MEKICYRKLRTYKFQLMDDYVITIDIEPEQNIETVFINLNSNGELTVKKRYAWDGPSGPTFDTKNFLHGSLVHDALYQLLRENHLTPEKRDYADQLLKKHCLEDGMSKIRAWYVHKAVSWFGKSSAKPIEKEDNLLFAP